MTAPRLFLSTLLAVGLAASAASAQCYYPPIPQAPDACGPGYWITNACGMCYGPNYCVYPCFPPFQGMIKGPPPKAAGGAAGAPYSGCAWPGPLNSPVFPTHPYARSPRDYFMYYDRDIQDQRPY